MSPEALIASLIEDRLASWREGDPPLILGLCGSQGSGKSTVARELVARFPASAVLSLDDIYHTRAEREQLARDVHPLFRTRGVPGTHDVDLGIATIGAVRRGEPVALPRFDKALDDRVPEALWPRAPAGCALLIFEGWCVGARPQPVGDLVNPINGFEAVADSDGTWRTGVNATLGSNYQNLFALLDALVLMIPPDWPTVLRWRIEQEEHLRQTRGSEAGVMNRQQLEFFVSHYERLTRAIWREMPKRANLSLRLTGDRTLLS